jgi:hypothetical protein
MSELGGNYPPGGGGGAPVGAQYVVLAVDGTLTAERVLTAGRWMAQTDAGANGNITYDFTPHRDYVVQVDEFCFGNTTTGRVGELGWLQVATGSGTIAATVGVANHPGIYTLSTGTTSGSTQRIDLTAEAYLPADIDSIQGIIRPTVITSAKYRFGLLVSTGTLGEGSDGVYFSFSPADSANWRAITESGGVKTATNTTVAVTANNWYFLELRRLSNGNWEFYVNNVLEATHSTNIPTAANEVTFVAENTAAANKTLDVDWFYVRSKQLGQRWT